MRRTIIAGVAIAAALLATSSNAGARQPRVLRVGSFHGIPGQYRSIQQAIDAARSYDWILIGPGDYKTTSIRRPKRGREFPAAILITTPDLRLRGMNRNTVVVDGTIAGAACNRRAADQSYGLRTSKGPTGLNGIMVWKADDVWVQNLTACNFLGGSAGDGQTGNEIWFNGGANSGAIGGWGYDGSYLTATSRFYANESSAAQYGIYSSNWHAGTFNQVYASNFSDSGVYIGACQKECDQTVQRAWAQFNAFGYSGTNSGGRLVVEDSQFDHNEAGFDANSQNGDNPPPQDGACPGGATSPITHTHSCWVFIGNYVHDNNNPDVPAAGEAAAAPVGTGLVISGGRDDTVIGNRFDDNDAWGVIFTPYLDNGRPCTGGTFGIAAFGPTSCLFDDYGNALIDNTFAHDGSYGHPSNGDFAQVNEENGHPTDCYSANSGTGGASLTPDDVALQQADPLCTGAPVRASASNPDFLTEALCDSQLEIIAGTPASCPTGQYPRRANVVMHPLPRLAAMPNPCAGVPANPWCPVRRRTTD